MVAEKIQTLNKLLNSNKLFLNMIIHDLRNPAMSIIFGLQESIEALANELKNDGLGQEMSAFAPSKYGSITSNTSPRSRISKFMSASLLKDDTSAVSA